jgi:hypothetical protein
VSYSILCLCLHVSLTCCSCLTGLPIEGAILADEGTFLGLQLFSACCIFTGTFFMAGARVSLGGWSMTKLI